MSEENVEIVRSYFEDLPNRARAALRRFIRVEDHLTAKGALHALGFSDETPEAVGLRE
jgi:hypothetical protein